jgi:hypothetical protein
MKLLPFPALLSCLSALSLLLAVSCASKPSDDKNTSSTYRQGVPGGTWVENYKIPVTIASINRAAHKVTIVASDNSKNTFTPGPDFKGFDKLKVGQKCQALVARELVVFLRSEGEPPAADVSIAKKAKKDGDYSGLLTSGTVEKIARVSAIDPAQGQATLQFADGTTRNVNVRTDVNLHNYKSGAEVVIRTRSALVLELAEP